MVAAEQGPRSRRGNAGPRTKAGLGRPSRAGPSVAPPRLERQSWCRRDRVGACSFPMFTRATIGPICRRGEAWALVATSSTSPAAPGLRVLLWRRRGHPEIRDQGQDQRFGGIPWVTHREIPMATVVEDRWAPVGSLRGCRRLGLEHDPCGDPAGFDVGYGLVDLVERSRFADHACLASAVELEHLA
jgi:hypothetical protein